MFKYSDIIEYIDGTWDDNFAEALKWCNDNNATLDELLERREEREGQLYRYFQINELKSFIPELSLDELKQQKKEEINHARDEAEQGGFEYMGKTFDSDLVSAVRIQGAAQLAMQIAEDYTIVWTCQDNTTISLKKNELIGLSNTLAQWSNTCHEKATDLKAQIDLAQSKEDLDLIVW